jgi:hypothetical protein
VLRLWISQGVLYEPPWTLEQLHTVRDAQDPDPRPQAAHGTTARWNDGCSCATCRRAHNDLARTRKRANAQKRLPVAVRQEVLDAIYSGQPFRTVLYEFGLTSNQVFGLARADEEWSRALEAALTATRRDDLQHGTNAAYVHGCVCSECRKHQRIRMARNPRLILHPTVDAGAVP